MTQKELKKLSRADLLEMLIEQSAQLQALKEELAAAQARLEKRELVINEAGSLAEAALQLNGVFEAAQAAGQQYLDNIRLLSARQSAVCAQLEEEARAKGAEIVAKAKAEAQAYWDEVSVRLDAFYKEHAGLRELLPTGIPKQ